MASIQATFNIQDIALVAATAKTVLQIKAPTNQRIKVYSFSIFFKDTISSDTPVEVQLIRQSTAIGGTPTALVAIKNDLGVAETIQTTAAIYGTSPTEPTTTDIRKMLKVHPQSGYEVIYSFGQELLISGGGRLGIVVTAAQAQSADVQIDFEE